MNVFTASGNLGRDCRLNQTQSGTAVVGFAVAVKSGYGDNEQTIWVDCSLFGNRANSLAPYLLKGQQVVVSGELGQREHEGKTYITLRCNDVTLVGGKPSAMTHDASQNAYQQPQQAAQPQNQGFQQQPQGGFQQPAQQPQSGGFAQDDMSDIPFDKFDII